MALCLGAILLGCGSAAPRSTAHPTPSQSLANAYFVLGLSAAGKTYDLTPGRLIGVSLTGAWSAITSSNPAVLKPSAGPMPADGATVSMFETAGLGQAVIVAKPAHPGPQWSVTVVVAKGPP